MGSEPPVARRLAAVLAADVAGFSSLMERDEDGTYARVAALRRDVVEPLAARHRGRLFKTTGDGFLLEFSSALDAVRCAIAIQADLSRDAAPTALRLRIGVNLGDVIVEPAGDLYGSGVNVAVRLEQAGTPGGILVSEPVFGQVQDRPDIPFVPLGTHVFKNLARPVAVFGPPGSIPDRATGPASPPLPAKPSIAVLPFLNAGGDAGEDYLADGFTTEITTGLAKLRWLFVIAPQSGLTYKGARPDRRQIGRELGVRYLLEGSVRRAGSRFRISAQLIEAETGAHLWADRFDGAEADIFDLEDQVTERVVATIEPRLRHAEIALSRRKRPDSLTAYDLVLRALPHYYAESRDGLAESMDLLGRAMALDPDYAPAYALASQCVTYADGQGWLEAFGWTLAEGAGLARAAVERDRDDPTVLWMAAHSIAALAGDYDLALEHLRRSLALNGNSASAHDRSGWVHCYAGDPRPAIDHFGRAMRLSPVDQATFRFHSGLALAHVMLGEFEDALAWSQRTVGEQPAWWTSGYRTLAASLAHLGRVEEAQEAGRAALRLDGTYTLGRADRMYRDSPGKARLIAGMRLAGLPG